MEKTFNEKLLYFRIRADFEADDEIDCSGIGNKTIKFFFSKIRNVMFFI